MQDHIRCAVIFPYELNKKVMFRGVVETDDVYNLWLEGVGADIWTCWHGLSPFRNDLDWFSSERGESLFIFSSLHILYLVYFSL